MKDRTVRILDILSNNKSIKINLLAEILDVSNVTLRKDLDNLEKRGIICRTHGYASLDGANDTGKRMAFNHSVKRRIAKAAAQTIEDGETVMIESGSCCALFTEELALERKNVTIVTNSLFIVNHVGRLSTIKIILLGGYYLPDSQVMVGPVTVKCAECFSPNKFFLGTDGFIENYGFTGRDHLRIETAVKLAKRAEKVFILTESAKFNRHGTCNLMPFEKIAGVFTDDGIPKEAEVILNKNSVLIHKIPSVEEKMRWRQFPGQTPFLYTEKE
jgi:DeoR/GlpR family transcriptional regulator of sugar metabolism